MYSRIKYLVLKSPLEQHQHGLVYARQHSMARRHVGDRIRYLLSCYMTKQNLALVGRRSEGVCRVDVDGDLKLARGGRRALRCSKAHDHGGDTRPVPNVCPGQVRETHYSTATMTSLEILRLRHHHLKLVHTAGQPFDVRTRGPVVW